MLQFCVRYSFWFTAFAAIAASFIMGAQGYGLVSGGSPKTTLKIALSMIAIATIVEFYNECKKTKESP